MHSADTCIIKNMNQTFLGRHTHPHSAFCGNTHKKIVSQCRMLLRDAELTSSRMRTATTKIKLRPFIATNRLQGVLTNIHKYKPFRAFIRKTMWEQHMYTNIVANEASHITLFIYSSNWAMGQMVMDWTEASLMANVFFLYQIGIEVVYQYLFSCSCIIRMNTCLLAHINNHWRITIAMCEHSDTALFFLIYRFAFNFVPKKTSKHSDVNGSNMISISVRSCCGCSRRCSLC